MIKKIYRFVWKKLRNFVLKAYLAGRFDVNDVIIIASSPRSGSTLLGQILGSIPNSFVLFEPLHLKKVPEAEDAHFSWRTYVNPGNEWPEGEEFLKRVFEGRVINDWTSREMSIRGTFKSTKMIVKFVRVNRLLPWICKTFEIPSPILLMRHPCAVIASQLKSGWGNAQRPGVPPYLDKYPLFQSALSLTEGDEENLAALWALDQLPPLLQARPHPWTLITYEELVLRPEQTLEKIFQCLKLDVDMDIALSKVNKPSSVVSGSGISGIKGWKQQLTDKQVSRILNTVNSFGLTFYTQAEEADYALLNSDNLAEHIRKAGTN